MRASLIVSVALASILAASQPSFADSPVAPTLPAAANATQADLLVSQIVNKLKVATSLTADFQEIDAYPGEYRDLKQSGSVALARPDKLDISIQRFRRVNASEPWGPSGNDVRSVSDGTTYTYAFLHPHSTQIQRSPVAAAVLRSALRGLGPLGAFFNTEDGSQLPGQSGPATLLESANWEGATYQVLQYTVAARDAASATVATAYIGADLFIHRLTYTTSGGHGTTTREWTVRNVVVNPQLAASRFSYVPPKDATVLDRGDVADLVSPGSAAPDFTVYDRNGKAVKLSDYRGKTVVLDFWATWCWPCNQSLPHTEQIGKLYRDRGVVVLAVAVRDSKAGFGQWLKKHSYPDINFLFEPRPQGQDAASALYGVSQTPTAYVIDAGGKVVQTLEGYRGPSQDLEAAVASALGRAAPVASAN
jgi:peroxiredoxin